MMPQTLHFGSILLLILGILEGLIHSDFSSTLDNFDVDFKRGGGYAALLRVGSAAPGLVPAHGVQSPIL